MLTEDEAKTKWCPQYQVATSGGDMSTFETDNRQDEYVQKGNDVTGPEWHRTGNLHPTCCCIASACMAWRWARIPIGEDDTGTVTKISQDYGYCGLAGVPV